MLGSGLVPAKQRIYMLWREWARGNGQYGEQPAGVASEPTLSCDQVLGEVEAPAAAREHAEPERRPLRQRPQLTRALSAELRAELPDKANAVIAVEWAKVDGRDPIGPQLPGHGFGEG